MAWMTCYQYLFMFFQSNLQSIHLCLAFMQNFASNINNGETDFYMCCLQAGVIGLYARNDDDGDKYEGKEVADCKKRKCLQHLKNLLPMRSCSMDDRGGHY